MTPKNTHYYNYDAIIGKFICRKPFDFNGRTLNEGEEVKLKLARVRDYSTLDTHPTPNVPEWVKFYADGYSTIVEVTRLKTHGEFIFNDLWNPQLIN